jgi:hypothetical protein
MARQSSGELLVVLPKFRIPSLTPRLGLFQNRVSMRSLPCSIVGWLRADLVLGLNFYWRTDAMMTGADVSTGFFGYR